MKFAIATIFATCVAAKSVVAECTGTYQEAASQAGNRRQRPEQNTPCVGGCVTQAGRWGKNWCYTEPKGTKDRQWGAECGKCKVNTAQFGSHSHSYSHTSGSSHHSSSSSSHSHSHSSGSSSHSVTVTHESSGGHSTGHQESSEAIAGSNFSNLSFLESPDHMAEAERRKQMFLSEQVRLSRNRALKVRAYFNARDVAAAKHKATMEFYAIMNKAKSFHTAMKSLHVAALAHELAMEVKRRDAFTAWEIARNTNRSAHVARVKASTAYAQSVKAWELAADAMGVAKKTLAECWSHYRSTLKIRVHTREVYVKWAKAHRAAIKGRMAAGLKAAEAHEAHMKASHHHKVSVTVHIAAIKRRAAARAAAIRAHMAVKRHAASGFMYLAQKN